MTRTCSILLVALLIACAAVTAAPEDKKPAPVELKTNKRQASYAIGVNIARSLRNDGLDVDVEALAAGLRDIYAKVPSRLDREQSAAAVAAFQKELAEQRRLLGDKNKREGAAFLAENKNKQGIVALPSGLQYQVLKSGQGAQPKDSDRVRTHYHGTLIDGNVFDSSVERGEPVSFEVGGVIRGWTEALKRMRVGDKWRLFVPAELAYGPRGSGLDIGPHAVLVFEVELLGIE